MLIIQELRDRIFGLRTTSLFVLLTFLTIIHAGIWYIPNIGASLVYSSNPFGNQLPDPNAEYLWWNWLGNLLAWLIGISNKYSFICMHLSFSILFTCATYFLLYWENTQENAKKAAIIFFALPVSGTVFYWVGLDSLTLLLMAFSFFTRRSLLLSLLVGFSIGLQHFEQGAVAYGALLIAMFIARDKWIWPAMMVIGIAFGKMFLIGLIHFYEIPLSGDRGSSFVKNGRIYIEQFFLRHHSILWATMGIGWYVALRFFDLSKNRMAFYLPLTMLLALTPLVGDQTRVFAVCSFPLFVYYLILNEGFLNTLSRTECAALSLAAFVIPYVWVWGGDPKLSVLPYDVIYILNRAFGMFNIPVDPSAWPWG